VNGCTHNDDKSSLSDRQKQGGTMKCYGSQMEELLLQECKASFSEDIKKKVLTRMRNDVISIIARNDMIILLLAKHHFAKNGPVKSPEIRQKMRIMARLLKEVRERVKEPNLTFYEVIHPKNSDFPVSINTLWPWNKHNTISTHIWWFITILKNQ
jgi:hypothetical protein